MSILTLPRAHPEVILIDWHATLVDTHDAMYHAVDDVLPKLRELGLDKHLVKPEDSKTLEDAKLVTYVRDHRQLHPKIVEQRKISRTDIFEVLFGADEAAKKRAHHAFDESYRHYVGEVHPLESDTREQLDAIRQLGIRVGVITNRNRDFMMEELSKVEEGSWAGLFDTIVSGNDVERRKPAPDLLIEALRRLGHPADETVWYVGDSTTDVVAAKEAGVEAIFYNGVGWNQSWIDKIFPGTARHSHRPDAVIASMAELHRLARWVLAQEIRVERARGSKTD
ncbi:MAG: HAD family hydrolase [Pseudomonadota bacterium]